MSNVTFNAPRLKASLKLAVSRLRMLQNKKQAINQQQRREIANLLEKGKEESARIRVEHIIREDFTIEALEILELYCDLLLARFGLIEQLK
jgi:vacuolar protein sorting-associated protein IST1